MKVISVDNQRPLINSLIPRHPFSLSIIGAKSSGKSNLLINLLSNKEGLYKKFNRIILISPTASMDEKINTLTSQPILQPNYKLDRELYKRAMKKDIMDDDILQIKSSEYISSNDILNELTPQFLDELMEHQKNIIEEFGKPISDKVCLVLDDSIQNNFLHSRKFLNFVLLSRHVNISLILISQAYYLINKSIRLNCSVLVLFEIANKKEIESIVDENNIGVDRKKFIEIYNNVMKTPFNFLTINHQNLRGKKLIKCFENFI